VADINVAAGGNLQTAIDNAALGDRILLEAGATFTGNFVLRNKLTGSGYITIRTDAADGDLPAAGVRIDPTYLPFCATIATGNATEILRVETAAHHYKFLGIHFPPKPAPNGGFGTQMSLGGSFSPTPNTVATMLTDFEFDRCILRGHPTSKQLRAMYVGCHRFRFVNNYCDRYGAQSQQSNCLLFTNGFGDITIENNYIQGSTQPIMFGGTSPAMVVATVTASTASTATLSSVTDLAVGQRISFLCAGGTVRRHPKCLTRDAGTGAVTFEPLDVVPDIPGDARWGIVEKNITIARNHIAHDPDEVRYGILNPCTGVSTAVIAGSFGAGSPTYRVQGFAPGYNGQEARGAASAATAPEAIVQDEGVRVTYTPVVNGVGGVATGHYVYRTLDGIITRFTTGVSGTFDDVGTGGTVVASVPNPTFTVGFVGIEFKHGINIHIHSNIVEWTYKGGFGGEGFTCKCSNQNGPQSFLSSEDILIENNVVRHTYDFSTVSGTEGNGWTFATAPRPLENLTFRNNLCYDSLSTNVGSNQTVAGQRFMGITNGAKNVHVIHNTSTHEGSGCFTTSPARGLETGLVIRDNMLRGNTYVVAGAPGYGNVGLDNTCGVGGWICEYNAFSASTTQTQSHVVGFNNTYTALATWLTSFVDATGPDIADYALAGGSPYNNAASDGTDIGCDITALLAAVDGVEAGTAAGTPVPTVVTTTLPSAIPNTSYAQTLVASGGTSPYAWDLTAGTLPPGVALEGYGTTIAETSGLLAYFRLNELTGSVAYDHLGGPAGAYTGSPTLGTTGTLSDGDKGVTLNGSSQYVLVGNVATLRPSAAVSVEAIVKPGSVTGTQNIAGVGGPTVGYCLRLSGSEARFIVGGVTASVAGLSIGTTYHLVGTYDGSNVRLYVDGTVGTPQAKTGSIDYGSDVNFVIGNRHGIPGAQYFNGVVEEVSVYNVALSQGTVTAHNTARTAAAGDELRGTPTTDGTYTFSVRVTDDEDETATQSLSIVVATPLAVPVISTTAAPDATFDEAYSFTLSATDGVLPYTWSVVDGQLPPGLGLDVDSGEISGTPTLAGPFAFTVLVQDALSTDSVTRVLQIIVVAEEDDLPTGRNRKENSMEAIVFRRATAPTLADGAISGDIWTKTVPGVETEGYLAQRTGDNLIWRAWPTNEGRVRQIAQEEMADILSKTDYDVTWTGSGGNPAIGNGTIEGLYSVVGKHVTARIKVVMGSTTTFGTGNWSFTLPSASDLESSGSAHGFDGTTRYSGGLLFATTSTVQVFVSGGSTLWGPTSPHTWATGDILVITVDYWTA
jgi:hypothetical protein